MSKQELVELKIPGTTGSIKIGNIYTVSPKADGESILTYEGQGLAKPIDPELNTLVNPPFNVDMGVWDLGFHEHSPCLNGMDDTTKKAHLAKVKKYIVEPVENIKGEGFLDHKSTNKNLDDWMINLAVGNYFDTNKPLHLFSLYAAMLGKELAPKEQETNPIYRKAQFCVENKENEVNIKQNRAFNKSKAIGQFHQLLETDRKHLYAVLNYLGIAASKSTPDHTLNSLFERWLDNYKVKDTGEEFVNKTKYFVTEKGKEELYLYQQLEDLVKKGTIKHINKSFYLDGEDLGTHLKTIASQIVEDDIKKEQILEMHMALDK
ncbi:MAG: hypothetical protein CMH22_06330 [Methylophaga sp.]|nr:hypothetical protein [Methylophaga sp.]|tara:strand:- start:21039 stop:21998 length:960 start_codon:yes stop_codon:yes gene_type:complete